MIELNKAKNLIDDFCMMEYGSSADFGDLSQVGLAYTILTEEELPDRIREKAAAFQIDSDVNDIQVNANLVDFRLERYLNGILVDSTQLTDTELEWLDFESLISFHEYL